MQRALVTTSLVGVLLAFAYLVEGQRYPLGTAAQPGPGLYPLLVGALLLLGSLGTAAECLVSRRAGGIDWPRGHDRWRLLAIVGASVGYVVLLPYLGHPVVGSLVTLVALQVMGLPGRLLKVCLSLGMGVGSYYLFAEVLGVPLPMGTWFG